MIQGIILDVWKLWVVGPWGVRARCTCNNGHPPPPPAPAQREVVQEVLVGRLVVDLG